ncbi:hypothetical protein I3760_11G037500, partial [Carya illinoinensis]
NKKANSWNHLDSVHQSFKGPWICISKFNDITNRSEKHRGRPTSNNLGNGIKELMSRHGIIDIGFTEPQFTWSNNKHGSTLIRERLDRVIINQEWRLIFPDAVLQHLTSSASDHHPLLLHTATNIHKSSSFKFETF